MDRRTLMVAASTVQLSSNLAGLVVSVHRRHPYELPVMRGRPEAVARDALSMGTALSAPVPMLAAQAWALGILLRRPSGAATRTLGILGALMVPGYLAERLVRRRLTVAGRDSVETPVAALGLATAGAMAILGSPAGSRRI